LNGKLNIFFKSFFIRKKDIWNWISSLERSKREIKVSTNEQEEGGVYLLSVVN